MKARYLITNKIDRMDEYTSSERLVIMFVSGYKAHNGHGPTRREIMERTGISSATFSRVWKRLRAADILMSEKQFELSAAGQQLAEAEIFTQR